MNLTFDEGLAFGLGLFETMLRQNGELILLDYHRRRLEESLKALTLPQSIDEIMSYLVNKAAGPDCAVKLVVTPSQYFVQERPVHYKSSDYNRGFRLTASSIKRNESSPLVFHKTLNYGDNILVRRQAKEQGYDEAYLLNSQGHICECSCSNIFFYKDGQLYTPPLADGLLPGTRRAYIMDHIPVKETTIKPEDLGSFTHCFLTNALMGYMPVRSIDDHEYAVALPTGLPQL